MTQHRGRGASYYLFHEFVLGDKTFAFKLRGLAKKKCRITHHHTHEQEIGVM